VKATISLGRLAMKFTFIVPKPAIGCLGLRAAQDRGSKKTFDGREGMHG
jgi:hypothetical protein